MNNNVKESGEREGAVNLFGIGITEGVRLGFGGNQGKLIKLQLNGN